VLILAVSCWFAAVVLLSCADAPPQSPPDVASDVLLICGQAPRPAARPSLVYVLAGDTWMATMTERDFDLVMVDQDLLVGWQRCATEAIAIVSAGKATSIVSADTRGSRQR
jgi:hypothetical protein